MQAVEFTTELSDERTLSIPEHIANQLPKQGSARVIILTPDDVENSAWQRGTYEQFMRDDAPEDDVYDTYL